MVFYIPVSDQICNFCNKNGIGDEIHVLFVCTNTDIVALRNRYVPSYYVRNPCIKMLFSYHAEVYIPTSCINKKYYKLFIVSTI